MTMALANMQIVISRLLRSLRITKGPTRWLNGEPHRQRENLLDRPDGHKRACTSPSLHACSCQAGAQHFQQCAEFLLLRNRGLGPLVVSVLPIALARRAAATACAAVQSAASLFGQLVIGRASRSWSALRTDALSEIAGAAGSLARVHSLVVHFSPTPSQFDD